MPDFIVQKIEKKCKTDIDKAIKYYTILFSLNNIYPSSKQIELIAFTAIRGTISSPTAREEFIKMFDSSLASMENIKCKLVKRGWLVKQEGKIKVNDVLVLDFTGDLIIQIKLCKPDDRISSKSTDSLREIERGVVQEGIS